MFKKFLCHALTAALTFIGAQFAGIGIDWWRTPVPRSKVANTVFESLKKPGWTLVQRTCKGYEKKQESDVLVRGNMLLRPGWMSASVYQLNIRPGGSEDQVALDEYFTSAELADLNKEMAPVYEELRRQRLQALEPREEKKDKTEEAVSVDKAVSKGKHEPCMAKSGTANVGLSAAERIASPNRLANIKPVSVRAAAPVTVTVQDVTTRPVVQVPVLVPAVVQSSPPVTVTPTGSENDPVSPAIPND